MEIKTNGQRNITLDFNAPKKFRLLKDGQEIPYLRTGKNSFRLGRNVEGVLNLEEIIEQPKIVKPMQLQAQQMALVNPNDVLMINQAAQQLEVEQNLLSETQKRVEQTQDYLDIQQQKINETVLSVHGLETENAERITATENGIFNLAGNLASTEQNLIDSIGIVNNSLQEHKSAENPHGITKKTIGLDKVDNTSDIDKPISKAVQSALDEKADKDEIQAIRDELGEYQEKNDRFTNALSNYTGGLAGNQLPDGGLQGQILAKRSDMSGDAEWIDNSANIIIDDELSLESENPVQNKVITNALNEKADILDIPTVNNATLNIQKNGTSVGTFSANASEDVNINLIIPTTASDVSALPDSTKYGAGLSLTINSTNYVMTAQLKDQDGNNIGTAQTIDLPLESVVVSGSYDSVNKKIILTLQNGTTIDIPVGDLISGLQTEITVDNKLSADLVDDSTSTNKFVTATDIRTWNGKQDAISDLSTIRSNATAGKSASDTIATYGDIVMHNASEFATSAQGALADSALQSGDNITELSNNAGYITGITSGDVTTALGYTPYDSANPSGYITSSALTPYVLASSLATVATSGDYDDLINKPTIPTDTSDLTNGAGFITGITSGDVTTALGYTPYNSSNPNGYTSNVGTVTSVNNTSPDNNGNVSLNIPAAQVNSDWNAVSGVAEILNKPNLAAVATTGAYSDLTGTPTIPTVNNATLTITQGGTTKGTFTANASSDVTIDLDAGSSGGYYPDLLSFQWSDHLLNNVSWLRADTFSWQDGTVYEAAYQHLVADYNSGTSTTETVGSKTITVYTATDGHKIVLSNQAQTVQDIYNETGVSWYFILDTTNQRFKLPRTKFGFTGLRDSVGKYVSESLPNIKGLAYSNNPAGGSGYYNIHTGAFDNGGNVSSARYASPAGASEKNAALSFDASRSSSTYQDNAPVQQRATQMYLYFYVGDYTQTAIEQTAGLNAELFNGKLDTSTFNTTPHIVETYKNGTSWYRIWSDGWCEQGGYANTNATSVIVTFLKPFIDTNYNRQVTIQGTDGNYDYHIITAASQTGITIFAWKPSYWQACGYIS